MLREPGSGGVGAQGVPAPSQKRPPSFREGEGERHGFLQDDTK